MTVTTKTQEIPLVDLRAQYATIRDEVLPAISGVLDSMQLTIGPNVRAFDQEWATYCGTKHAIGVGSGTDALQLAIRALGISSGDEVITVSFTFFATVEAILYANARPILVDIDERTMTVIGSKKMAVYDDVQAVERVKVYDFGVEELSSEELRRSYRAGDIRSPRVPITEALQVEMRHFVECVQKGKRPRSDGEAGLRVVRVLEAGMRSLRSGGARVSYRSTPEAARA